MQHVQLGEKLMQRIKNDTLEFGKVETGPSLEGKQMVMIVQPL